MYINPRNAKEQWKTCSQGRRRTQDPVSNSPMQITQSHSESSTQHFETHCWLMLAALIPLDHTTPRESKKLMSSPCCRSFYPESVKTSQVDIDHDVECLLWHSYFFSSMSSTVPQGFNIILQHPVLTLYLKLLIILGTSVNAAPRDRLWKVSNC